MLVILNSTLLHNQNDDNCTSRHFRSGTYEISGSLVFVEQSVHTKLAPTNTTNKVQNNKNELVQTGPHSHLTSSYSMDIGSSFPCVMEAET